jgi:addiction module HigA family antidote
MTGSRGDSDPIHPGEILQAEFLAPHGLSRARLARATGLSYSRLARLARGRGRISGEVALLLARVFRTTPQFWLNLQAHYDLARAQAQLAPAQVVRAKAFGDRLQRARRRH